MNNKVFLLLLCLGMSATFIGCGHRRSICEVEETRCSGPLSDRDVEWDDEDYGDFK